VALLSASLSPNGGRTRDLFLHSTVSRSRRSYASGFAFSSQRNRSETRTSLLRDASEHTVARPDSLSHARCASEMESHRHCDGPAISRYCVSLRIRRLNTGRPNPDPARGQFGYRLVTYVNFCLLVTVWMVAARTALPDNSIAIVLGIFALAFAFAGTAVNLGRMASGIAWSIGGGFEKLPPYTLPSPTRADITGYHLSWGCFYATMPSTREDVKFLCDTSNAAAKFQLGNGITQIAMLPDVGQSSIPISTNVIFHPWNQLSVDGRICEACQGFRRFTQVNSLGNGRHELRYTFRPDTAYLALDKISIIFAAAALLAFAGLLVWRLSGRKKAICQ
jgi:hypothetical protein